MMGKALGHEEEDVVAGGRESIILHGGVINVDA